jgi:hypothetical protein
MLPFLYVVYLHSENKFGEVKRMRAIELENLEIDQLRKLAKKHKLKTKIKAKIIMALADDAREGKAPSIASIQPAPQSPPKQGDSVIWPNVPKATSEVNGDYVSPPWLEELEAAASIGHVELMGPAGSGKTLAIHHLAAKLGKNLAVVTADGGLRKRDLVGQRELIAGSTIFTAAEFATAAKQGDWALIDEANMAEPEAMSFINGMTDRPAQAGSTFQVAGQTVEVHPDFRCFMTRNPNYVGTRRMNEALRDRFWSIEVPPLSGKALATMFKAHGMKKAFINQAVFLTDTLYKAWKDNRIGYQISPRRGLAASKMASIMASRQSIVGFRMLMEKSILTKIDAQHDIDAVQPVIKNAWRALDIDADIEAEQ